MNNEFYTNSNHNANCVKSWQELFCLSKIKTHMQCVLCKIQNYKSRYSYVSVELGTSSKKCVVNEKIIQEGVFGCNL